MNRICYNILLLLLLVGCSPSSLEDTEEPVEILGSGTIDSPYELCTRAHLESLSQEVYAGDNKRGVYYILTSDIDLRCSAERPWFPIGSGLLVISSSQLDQRYVFKGNFNGNGHCVTGLYVDSQYPYKGLFGYLHSGVITDLFVEGYVCGGGSVGGLVGFSYGSVVEGCGFVGSVVGGDSVGGVVGSSSYSEVVGCYNWGSVSGGSSVGGLVGLAMSESVLLGSYSVGLVSGVDNGGSVGGVLGSLFSCSVDFCYSLEGSLVVDGGVCDGCDGCGGVLSEDYMRSSDFVELLNGGFGFEFWGVGDGVVGYPLPVFGR